MLFRSGGRDSIAALGKNGQALEFLKDQFRHCKPVLLGAGAVALLEAAGIPDKLPSGAADPVIFKSEDGAKAVVRRFIDAVGGHRHFERETKPPRV